MSEGRPGGSGMRRTTWADLAVPFLIIAIATYALVRFTYGDLPPLQYVLPVPLAALAAVEFVAARRVRAAVRHDPDAKAMAAIVIARCVALGKASALVAAGVTGAAVGLLARLIPELRTVDAAAHDTTVAALLLVSGALLVAAGLVLERAGVDPGRGGRESHRPHE